MVRIVVASLYLAMVAMSSYGSLDYLAVVVPPVPPAPQEVTPSWVEPGASIRGCNAARLAMASLRCWALQPEVQQRGQAGERLSHFSGGARTLIHIL